MKCAVLTNCSMVLQSRVVDAASACLTRYDVTLVVDACTSKCWSPVLLTSATHSVLVACAGTQVVGPAVQHHGL